MVFVSLARIRCFKMNKSKILLPILIFLTIIGLTFAMIYQHELVHKTIFKYYGMDSEIKLGWTQATTTPIGEYTCDSNCELAHSINEVVGYTIMPLLIFIFAILFAILYAILNKEPVIIFQEK